MTLAEEITLLTSKWYHYANLDHHKDRDCHWYIEKRWSYGDEPYYQAFHHGYLIEDWSSPKFSSSELAEIMLRNKLKNEIASAIVHLKDAIIDEETADWFGGKERILGLIRKLEE